MLMVVHEVAICFSRLF